jgi:hypothetical protein
MESTQQLNLHDQPLSNLPLQVQFFARKNYQIKPLSTCWIDVYEQPYYNSSTEQQQEYDIDTTKIKAYMNHVSGKKEISLYNYDREATLRI